MNGIKTWLKNNLLLCTLFFIGVSVSFFWFRKGLMFGGGEEGLPFYNIAKTLNLSSNVWYDSNGGYTVALFLPKVPYFQFINLLTSFGLSSVLLQVGTFMFLILTGVVSVFFLTKNLFKDSLSKQWLNWSSFIAALFYFFNPYSMSQIWSRGIYAQYFIFALAPLFLLLFAKGLKSGKYIYIFYATVVSFILSSAYVVATNAIILWTILLIYFLFHLWTIKNSNRKLLFSSIYLLATLLLWIFSNFWWFYPTLKVVGTAFSASFDTTFNINTLIAITTTYSTPKYVLRLLQKFIFFDARSYDGIYILPAFEILSWLIPLISVIPIFLLRKIKIVGFAIVLWLVGYLVSIGANPPLGQIFVWLFSKISFLQSFRNPYEKAGIIIMLGYTVLFSLGLGYLFVQKSKIKKVLASSILIGVCCIFVFPLWSGKFTNAWVSVPAYYKEADSWISSQPGSFKIMQLPLISGDGVRYTWEASYQGIEPAEFLFTNSSIGRNIVFNKPYYNVLLERFGIFTPGAFGPDPDISNSEFRSKEFWQELEKLNVRYLILHKDLDEKIINTKIKSVEDYLFNQKNIKHVKSFDQLEIYEVGISKNIQQIYSPTQKIKFEKINSTEYKIIIEDSKKPFDLYFLDNYDFGWELYIDDYLVSTHDKVFSYANKWRIDKTGSFDMVLKYKPQDYVTFGKKISFATILLMIIFILFKYIRSRSLEKLI